MKDSAVGPVGLLDPRRQERILDGLDRRCQVCLRQQESLSLSHAQERADDEKQISTRRAAEMEACRRRRTSMLTEWDAAEERLISDYEASAIETRDEQRRLAVVYRRKKAEGTHRDRSQSRSASASRTSTVREPQEPAGTAKAKRDTTHRSGHVVDRQHARVRARDCDSPL